MKDEELIRLIQEGQIFLFDELVRRYYEKIYKYCFYRVANIQVALDITQDVFMKVYENIGSYVNKGKFKNYLYVIAGNVCKDFFKKKATFSVDMIAERGNEEMI